jgi:hypothetical protein
MGHIIYLLVHFPISGCAYFSLLLEWRRWQNGIPLALARVIDTSTVITHGVVQVPVLGERAWLGVILSHMVIVIAPAA